VYAVAGEEADESLCKVVALCADVEVAECEGTVVVVEEAVLKMAEVDVIVVGLPSMELQAHKGRHGDDRDMSRQSSWEGAMPKSTQSSGASWT
jgi:hypothetical protein